MLQRDPIHLETHCLFSELDRAVPALFELPGVPISDGQIHRATETVKRMVDTEKTGAVLHLKARYNPTEGILVIAQSIPDKKTGEPLLKPLWGIRNLPVTLEQL